MKNKIQTLALTLLVTLSLSSCFSSSDDMEITPKPQMTLADSICGKWYFKHASGYEIEEYQKGGAFNIWMTMFLDAIYFNETADGRWSANRNALAISWTSDMLGQVTSAGKVTSITDYNITTISNTDGAVAVSSRIVNEMNMKAGDIAKLEIPAKYSKFVPKKYESDYLWVAKVDDSGNVEALARGTSYIIASDNAGNSVAVKVNVTADESIKDYRSCIGMDIEDAIKDYDQSVGFYKTPVSQGDIYKFYLRDEIVKSISFYVTKNTENIEMVSLDLQNAADLDAICAEYDRKYNKTIQNGLTYYWEGDLEKAATRFRIDPTARSITFSSNVNKTDDSLVPDFSNIDKMSISDFCNSYGIEIDPDDIDPDYDDQSLFYYPSNPAVEYAFVSYYQSTGDIEYVAVYMDTDETSEDEVRAYLESIYNHQVMGTNTYYYAGESLISSNVWITCKVSSKGKLYVSFMNNIAQSTAEDSEAKVRSIDIAEDYLLSKRLKAMKK